MRIVERTNNTTVISFANKLEVLFSYDTPVAGVMPSGQVFKTDKKWSVTTSKHIKEYLDGRNASNLSQDDINNIVERI